MAATIGEVSNVSGGLRDVIGASIGGSLAGEQSVLLAGPAGVGKSHLARAVADDFVNDGWYVFRMIGGPSTQAITLGAAHSLLSSTSVARSPDELLANAELELRRRAGGQPVLLVVDDINYLDPASVGFVQRLVISNAAAIATVRSEVAGDPVVVSLWKDGLFERVDIEEFGAAGSQLLVNDYLGGQANEDLHRQVFSLADGNALFTCALLADAVHSGTVTKSDGVWRANGDLRAEHRVSDLFAARLAALAPESLHALESIALGEPMSLALAGEVAGLETLEHLEADGLIAIENKRVTTFHPLFGEVVQRETPSLRRTRLTNGLIEAVVASDVSSPADMFRAARWQLGMGQAVAADVAVAATQHALAIFDGPTAVASAQAALSPTSSSSHVALGRALFLEGRMDESLKVLREGSEIASTDTDRALAAVAIGEVLGFGTGAFADGISELEDALAATSGPPERALIAGTLGLVAALAGSFEPALRYGDELIDSPEIDDIARLQLLNIWTVAAVWTGSPRQTAERLEMGIELAETCRSELPAARDQLLATKHTHHLQIGELSSALRISSEQRDAALQEGRLGTLWAMTDSISFSFVGQGRRACERSEVAVAGLADFDPIGVAALALAAQAVARALTGDVAGALASHDASLADPRCGTREQAVLATAHANVLAFEGDIDAAVATVEQGAVGTGCLVWAAQALYQAVRFDRAADVQDQMRDLAERAPCEWVLALNEHCEALVAADAVRLAKAGERLAQAGLTLYAAEAVAHASHQLTRDGDRSGSALSALRAFVIFDGCDGVRSLGIENLVQPLTKREFEVAASAGAGETSQTIADRLFVARRTVDNHLQNVYRKLGIGTREELQAVFKLPEHR